jgi:hypothetical protein
MNCEKSHGWMEPKYHPSVYLKKRKESDKDLYKNIVESKEGIICKPISKHQIGSPFFQVDRENSDGSKRTKAKTFNNTSDRSNDGSSVRDKEEYVKSEKLHEETISLAWLEDPLWRDTEPQDDKKSPLTISRAKSLGKPEEYDINYSKSIKDVDFFLPLDVRRDQHLNQAQKQKDQRS